MTTTLPTKFTPKKSLGQNFLINPHIIDRIIDAARISEKDLVLEIGPGTGNLTEKLAKKAGQVIAIEKDNRLIEPLREKFKNFKNIEIIEGDVLAKMPFVKQRASLQYKIVANIPYYITSNLFRKIFEEWPRPELVVLTIQKEVAQRITAKPPHMNLLALSVQYYAEPEVVVFISKNNFRPIPKVDSAIIRLNPKSEIRNPKKTEEIFKVIKGGFSEKRKQLASNLSKKLKLSKSAVLEAFKTAGIKELSRPENLSLNDWENLAEALFG
ncbi:MAG: ribosomal RNA small subunit methyltransferase A [Candidatus Yanofskybacteria bacterium RIFCSPHIGHO2_02_FULL_44_12b]|uniref:Ribosomal RNA small subunit methyltransferase A n=2 Tax=Candidatus Yanofskyibacteriota TaxID=1752733 RepID=A0A1F8GJ43_9BACT|nr:MAG: Ribosomal RNA small subunit methyltransferase A [Candidatus Yanofskybacteria bacterium GW2011_GWA2_44_9]OGN05424.1 MAG: ribosomal RNA small subunit methyltransferase A [Candidatus Yanofskybacteria bacterium RIFCSPHIGHO2_01_FULL_44_24]OGN15430.1 MAG: ribosomal RNA small subunit methyltransferase A [Candidatus Yanofskybacteria bacterium RIFCSPHIGHO2_02_FULL_44_12b]OGN25414.1 MAG: ribosomal RNA small subunit methyltransferase A [Candidatus Yanofskybacteria bacterium RIFCSPLOWO2_01_FULL_44_2